MMIQALCEIADKLGLEKLIAEVPDSNSSAIRAISNAGFHRGALLHNLANDKDGMPQGTLRY
jgi:L-amino acid N-acyltransferase YncA